jgi:hypothetical protein
MYADPNERGEAVLTSMLCQRTLNRHGTFQGRPSVVEGNEEPVPRVVDNLAAVWGKQGTQRLIVPGEEVLPGLIADRTNEVRGLHDVGEHERALHSFRLRSGGELPQELVRPLDGPSSAESIECGPRGTELHERCILVAHLSVCLPDLEAQFGRFVQCLDLLPPLQRAPKIR